MAQPEPGSSSLLEGLATSAGKNPALPSPALLNSQWGPAALMASGSVRKWAAPCCSPGSQLPQLQPAGTRGHSAPWYLCLPHLAQAHPWHAFPLLCFHTAGTRTHTSCASWALLYLAFPPTILFSLGKLETSFGNINQLSRVDLWQSPCTGKSPCIDAREANQIASISAVCVLCFINSFPSELK